MPNAITVARKGTLQQSANRKRLNQVDVAHRQSTWTLKDSDAEEYQLLTIGADKWQASYCRGRHWCRSRRLPNIKGRTQWLNITDTPSTKKNEKYRICGDYKVTTNQVMEVYQYPLPKPENVFATLTGENIRYWSCHLSYGTW